MIEYKTQEMQMIPYKDRRKIEKKVLPEYYEGIRTHKKMFELRKDEDGIKPGDILVLREWDGEKYTGSMTRREVTAVLKDCPEYGLMDGYCILSLQTPGWDFVKPSAQLDFDIDQRINKAYDDGYDQGYLQCKADQERTTGHWIERQKKGSCYWQSWCSVCGKHSGIGGIESNRHKPFCPNCGSPMSDEVEWEIT